MPIDVYLRPLPETRTPTLDCKWRAEVAVGAKTHVAESRHGVTHEIARTLKNAGLPDAAMHIHYEGRPGYMAVPSFHAWAEWTYSGDALIPYATAQAKLERLAGLSGA